ncbi:alkylation response protein AidB-like acyl-CoA dehydrogenase [Actinocorallia herbida]|uniref:Alkylation response protein AidB-like acyl-CoA dehydrogenase n=1 Tax=Actinocorallia herbida TaxID=58109 RepID=A0A3N1D1V3_9ACTN|nr:acyl-CoA dehydrogenase family protein [Actinocorallia herbida]ROO87460.1 alkylation response protein AidB-like acyl-CoA dehydrogenase [Actinocorallia herbida]
MSIGFTEDHEHLRELVRRFLQARSPSHEVRRLIRDGLGRDDEVWFQMAGQLGLQGIAIPEEYGGSGFGPTELGIVLEEMGRVLLVAPYFSTVALAGQTLTASDDEEARRRWLPGIADGSLTATLAVAEHGGTGARTEIATIAEPAGDGWALTGTKLFVLDGHTADLLLVVARAEDGIGLFGVEGDAAGVVRTELESLDLTRGMAEVVLDAAPAIRVGGDRPSGGWLPRVRDLVLASLAAEQIGGAARCLELAVEYAKVREQFGRPIGSFQAVKHKCAGLLIEIEAGRSAAYHAGFAVAEPGAEGAAAAALAKAYCSEVFTHAAKECIQIHGGIGYTWEHDAHLFLRRAKSSELLFGTPARQRARFADLVEI